MPTARKLATKAEILKRLRPFLAQDAKEEDVKAALDETDEEREAREKKEAEAKAADEREDDDREDDAEDESPDEDDDDKMKAKDRKGAKDAKTAKDAKPAAMDEAIRVAITAERTRSAAVALAREDVRPIVGAVSMAIDDAGEIYKIALKHLGADISDVPPAAYRSVLKTIRSHMPAQPKAGFVGAMDAAHAGVGKILDGLFANVRKS